MELDEESRKLWEDFRAAREQPWTPMVETVLPDGWRVTLFRGECGTPLPGVDEPQDQFWGKSIADILKEEQDSVNRKLRDAIDEADGPLTESP